MKNNDWNLKKKYHQRECDGNEANFFNGPEDNEAEQLDEGEKVDSAESDLAQVNVIRLVLCRHEEEQQPIVKLHVSQR